MVRLATRASSPFRRIGLGSGASADDATALPATRAAPRRQRTERNRATVHFIDHLCIGTAWEAWRRAGVTRQVSPPTDDALHTLLLRREPSTVTDRHPLARQGARAFPPPNLSRGTTPPTSARTTRSPARRPSTRRRCIKVPRRVRCAPAGGRRGR